MNDEQLRKFCLEQAVELYTNRIELTGLACRESIHVLDIANALFNYIKNGEIVKLPFCVCIP